MPGFWLTPAPGKTQGLGRVGGVLEDAEVLEGSWDSPSEWAPKMLRLMLEVYCNVIKL